MHRGAFQLKSVLILSQNLSVQCSVFILSYLSEIFDLKACLFGSFFLTETTVIIVNLMKTVNTRSKFSSSCSFPTQKP